jgi:hypothetical protein
VICAGDSNVPLLPVLKLLVDPRDDVTSAGEVH